MRALYANAGVVIEALRKLGVSEAHLVPIKEDWPNFEHVIWRFYNLPHKKALRQDASASVDIRLGGQQFDKVDEKWRDVRPNALWYRIAGQNTSRGIPGNSRYFRRVERDGTFSIDEGRDAVLLPAEVKAVIRFCEGLCESPNIPFDINRRNDDPWPEETYLRWVQENGK